MAMAALIRWLVLDPAYARRLGAAARAYAETQGWESVLDGLLEDYAALIETCKHTDGWREAVVPRGFGVHLSH